MTPLEDDRSLLEIGLSYARADLYQDGIKYLSLAIDGGLTEEDEFEARGWRTICFGQSGCVEEAQIDANWLIDRGAERHYLWRAHLKERLHDYHGAILDYTHIEHYYPEQISSELYLKRGQAYFFSRQYQQAVQDFTQALSLEQRPTIREALYGWRGKAYVELGEDQAGLSDFQEAIELVGFERHVTGWYFHRGLARERLGDVEGAVLDFRRATIEPDHPEASRIMRLLEEAE